MDFRSAFTYFFSSIFLLANPGHDNITSLTDEIRKNCSIEDKITVYSGLDYGTHYEPSILEECSLCGSLVHYLWPEFNTKGTHVIGHAGEGMWEHTLGELYKIAALYHEMGHISHNDGMTTKDLESKIARYNTKWQRLSRQSLHHENEINEYRAFLQNEDFANDMIRIRTYVRRAKKFFLARAQRTILGTYIAKTLRKEKKLWEEPDCGVCAEEMRYKRGKEARADLFAAEKMWLNGRLDVITAIVYLHASGLVVAGSHDMHPSGLERALMFIGFLDEKGVDIHSLIGEFEKNPVEKIHENKKEYLLTQVKDELISEHYYFHTCHAHSNGSCPGSHY